MKSFDDLFDEFFNKKSVSNPLHDEIKKIIDSLANFKTPEKKESMNPFEMDTEEKIAKYLGIDMSSPTSVEEVIEDRMKFTKLTWDTPRGKFVKVVVTDVVDGQGVVSTNKSSKSLEEQLQEAVDNEDYELAIKLRDKIKSIKELATEKEEKKSS